MRNYQTLNLFWFSQGSMAEWRNKAWVWGVGEGDRAGLHDVLHHVHLHLWVNTHVENIIKIKPKHHHEEHHDAPHEPHLLCMLEVSWEHPRCLDPHGASHKGLRSYIWAWGGAGCQAPSPHLPHPQVSQSPLSSFSYSCCVDYESCTDNVVCDGF